MDLPLMGLALVSYLVGSVSPAILVGRYHGSDIRQLGSGNAGATNVARSFGKGWGLLVLALDVLKGGGVFLLASLWGELLSVAIQAPALAGFFVVLGHCYPIFYGFRGGKGVATALGVFLVFSPLAALAGAGVFALVLTLRRQVSLASLLASLGLLATVAWLAEELVLKLMTLAIVALIVLRHRSNIHRLQKDTEPTI
jgi:acyl phosphate:glycerol-3-phosphate acyltransferase